MARRIVTDKVVLALICGVLVLIVLILVSLLVPWGEAGAPSQPPSAVPSPSAAA
jgi:hypothetical protein